MTELMHANLTHDGKFRSALDPGSASRLDRPSVGIIVPVYNEAHHLDRLVDDLLDQDYPVINEICLVDGGSGDGSATRLQALRARDTRIKLLNNPRRIPAAALNLALAQMRTDIVLRLDAHAHYAADVVRRGVEALLATGAGGVGAIQRPACGSTLAARAIVAAHKSRLGLGGAKFREEGAAGWVDTVWNGCYWRHVVDEVGMVREDLWRAEDNDFNERVRRLGYGLYLCPAIRAFYQPRQTLGALWSQYLSNGKGVAFAWFDNPRAFGLRHVAPLAFVAAFGITLVSGLVWPLPRAAFTALCGLYLAALLAAVATAVRSDRGTHLLLLPFALATLHFSYGFGSLWGLGLRALGAGSARSTPRRGSILRSLAVLCLAGLAAGSASAAEPTVWLAPSLERIGRDAAPGTGMLIELYAGRREVQSFQVGIHAPPGGLTNVAVTVGDFRGQAGARVPASAATLFREHYVQVTRSSPDPGGSNRPLGPGWYADALEPLQPAASGGRGASGRATGSDHFDVAESLNQPVWVDVSVPADAASGRYRAEVTVRSDQGVTSGTLEVIVWDFTLPTTPALDSMFLLWTAHDRQAATELLKHRLMPRSVDPADEARLIEAWGLKSTNLGFWSGATHSQCTMAPAPSEQTVREAAALHDPALRLYNITADEIDQCPRDLATLKAWARVLHAAGANNLVTMSPRPELYDDGGGARRSAVDVWVLLPGMYDAAKARVVEVLRKGDQVWSYNALVQDDYSPKWEIDFAPINYRIMPGFLNMSLGMTGVLYWRADLWTDDPWTDVQTYRKDGNEYPGEGMLLYPGQPIGLAGVVPSMRLKWLRDGVQDYDYLSLLKQHGCAADVARSARIVARSWSAWTRDPAVLESERRRLGSLLDQIGRGQSHCGS